MHAPAARPFVYVCTSPASISTPRLQFPQPLLPLPLVSTAHPTPGQYVCSGASRLSPRISWCLATGAELPASDPEPLAAAPPAPPPPVPASGSAHRSILPRIVADDPGAPRVPPGELADVVHLPLYHQPPLLFASRALRHLVPGEVAQGRPLGRGLGGHRGLAMPRADWVRAIRRAPTLRARRRSGGARPEPATSARGFKHPWRGPPGSDARAPIGRAAWREERAPAFR